ncbi:unnamed protein product, partial [Brassica rapa]
MVNRPAKIIQMVDRQVRNRLSSVRGVSEAIWHQVVAPLSKCEKNRVIIRNELGNNKQTWIYLWNYVLSKHTGIIIFGVVKKRLLQMFVPSEEFEKNGGDQKCRTSLVSSYLASQIS